MFPPPISDRTRPPLVEWYKKAVPLRVCGKFLTLYPCDPQSAMGSNSLAALLPTDGDDHTSANTYEVGQ